MIDLFVGAKLCISPTWQKERATKRCKRSRSLLFSSDARGKFAVHVEPILFIKAIANPRMTTSSLRITRYVEWETIAELILYSIDIKI